MNIIYTKSYDNSKKNLKRHYKEQEVLEKILELIRNTNSFEELQKDPQTKMYHLERLKYELNNFYSFYLDKDGGKFRLIIQPNKDSISLYMIYISKNHYDDFHISKVRYYEEE